jgi:flagellar hook-associated protein 2
MASSSSSSISTTTVNGRTVLSGLASGIDVDSIVSGLMKANSAKLDRLKQQQQLAEWRQEAYREIISGIQSFASKYFDPISSSSLMSQKVFNQLTVTSSGSAVSATYTGSATAGSHTVKVSQLATAASQTTSGRLSKDIQGSTAVDYGSLAGKSFTLALDGTQTTVTLDGSVTDLESLQAAIDDAVGAGKVIVAEDGSGLLSITAGAGVQALSVSVPSGSGYTSALGALGFGTGARLSNRISTSDTLETLAGTMSNSFTFNGDGQVELTVNGVNFSFDKDTTLSEMMSEINNSGAGVTIKYDELNDKLIMKANTTGSQKTLSVTESGSTFLTAALGTYSAGKDAKVTIDDMEMTRSSNTVTVDGVTYTFNQTTPTGETATVTLTRDVEAIYNSIKSFVDDYNSLIAAINGKLSEEYDPDYPPLTSAQEEEMSEDEIKRWNEKAKTGLLARDPVLQSMLDGMRSALIDSFSGQSLSLADIGITTGAYKYQEKGKLYIDEDQQDKLRKAIINNPEGVMDLFTHASSEYPGTTAVRKMTSSQLQVRYQQEGIAYRFYDILEKNVSIIRDNGGNKGLLLEKAGIEGDSSNTENGLTDAINNYKERIDKEQDRLDALEDRLYEQYTALETYIAQMNAQLSALASYLQV